MLFSKPQHKQMVSLERNALIGHVMIQLGGGMGNHPLYHIESYLWVIGCRHRHGNLVS
jgi:hypothetical protein